MRIGEFARLTGMPISVLRHYDKEGLLCPSHVDYFTGYRDYSADQLGQARKIELLKSGGLSLKEIRDILEHTGDGKFIRGILNRRESEYQNMLAAISEVRKMLEREERGLAPGEESPAVLEKDAHGDMILKGAYVSLPIADRKDFDNLQAACRSLEEEIRRRSLQRISGFITYGEESGKEIQVAAEVLELHEEMKELHEDIDIPFEDDEQVIGKWKVLGEYAVWEDFYADTGERREPFMGNREGEVFFLPGGEPYWIFSWTKGYLKLNGGDQSCLCRYELKEDDGHRYMFVENKGEEFRRGGMPTVLALEQMDHKKYTVREIAREDNTDMPFVEDERVLGDWKAFDFIRSWEKFDPAVNHLPQDRLMYKHMHFGEGGVFTSVYMDETISGGEKQSWTKGYVLKYYNHTACAYEIVSAEGKDYMIIEWKSGDYRWGGYDTDYYVFVRER